MSKPSPHNLIKSPAPWKKSRRPVWPLAALLLASILCHTSAAQQPQGPFFRFANLAPLGTPPLDLFCDDKPAILQTNPGFFMGYTPLPSAAPRAFTLKEGATTLASAPMPDAKGSNFFTVLATGEGSKIKLEVLDDTPASETDPVTGEKKPLKRLRVFSGPYKVPHRIDAGELGTWVTRTGLDPMRGEKIFPSTAVDSVKVTYIDATQNPVDLFYPADFSTNNQITVLVSQRGPQRLRVTAVPDAVAPPLENSEDSGEPAP